VVERLNEETKGVFIIAATPFAVDGSVDMASADSLVEFYIDKGVSGMTVLGMMGEAPKLAADEADTFMSHMLRRVDGRVPVIVGVSDPGIGNLARLAKSSMDASAAGVMVAPALDLNTGKQIHNYFAQVFDALGPDIPVCYQDYPQSTGAHISVKAFNRLVADFPQLVMFKHEDCPGLAKLSQIRETAESEGLRRVSILVGNGGLYLPQELGRGADGAMTGFAYPEMLVEVVAMFEAGEVETAEDLYDAYLPLVRYEQQPGYGLAVRKEVLYRRGAISSAATRAPGPALSAADRGELDHLISRLEKKLRDLGR